MFSLTGGPSATKKGHNLFSKMSLPDQGRHDALENVVGGEESQQVIWPFA